MYQVDRSLYMIDMKKDTCKLSIMLTDLWLVDDKCLKIQTQLADVVTTGADGDLAGADLSADTLKVGAVLVGSATAV